MSHMNMAWCMQDQVCRSRLTHCQPACSLTEPGWGWSTTLAVQCLILSSGLKDYGHLLALVSYRKAPIGVEHAFCLTPTDEDSHSATTVVLCFAIVCVCVTPKNFNHNTNCKVQHSYTLRTISETISSEFLRPRWQGYPLAD